MLKLNIIDSELELIPEEMINDYQIRKIAKSREKRPEELILDSNFMHGAIDRHFPGKSNRMGRPDIFHHLLNVTQDSILNKKGSLQVNIHTKNNLIIRINPETKVPRSYNRFVGIIEKLLLKGSLESPDGKILMNSEKGTWESLVDPEMDNVLLSPKGERRRISDFINANKDYNIFIGGFSEGDFSSSVYNKLKYYSIFSEELTIWTVAWELIASIERLNELI
jgi:rRNA small subunit pseudouridine methyltransferase Nep1